MIARTLVTLLLLGCAPVYRDVDGRVIPAPQLVGSTDGGAVVVDTASGMLRVIVELQFEVLDSEREWIVLPPVALRVGESQPLAPRRFVRDPLVCSRVLPGSNVRPVGPDRETGMRPPETQPRACWVLVRAEFPASDGLFAKPVALVVGSRVLAVQWRRR